MSFCSHPVKQTVSAIGMFFSNLESITTHHGQDTYLAGTRNGIGYDSLSNAASQHMTITDREAKPTRHDSNDYYYR
jgi:hypothetical protein